MTAGGFDRDLLCCGLCGRHYCECCQGLCMGCSWSLDLDVTARDIAEMDAQLDGIVEDGIESYAAELIASLEADHG